MRNIEIFSICMWYRNPNLISCCELSGSTISFYIRLCVTCVTCLRAQINTLLMNKIICHTLSYIKYVQAYNFFRVIPLIYYYYQYNLFIIILLRFCVTKCRSSPNLGRWRRTAPSYLREHEKPSVLRLNTRRSYRIVIPPKCESRKYRVHLFMYTLVYSTAYT